MLLAAFAIVVLLAVLFALSNGFIDGGGLVSTVVSTRTLDPLPAVLLVAACELAGLFLLGHAVARTVGRQLVAFPQTILPGERLEVIMAALLGAITWNLIMWRRAYPSSSSHALIGGLAGAALTAFGWAGLQWPTFVRVFLYLGLVPVFAVLVSYALARGIYRAGQYLTPGAGRLLRRTQILALAGMAMVHGSNDGQKAMGIIVLGSLLLAGRGTAHVPMPAWSATVCGLALAVGVVFGSRRTFQTVGRGLYRVQSLQGICAETSAMLLVGASSLAGYPMSTTHVMSTSVLGAGVAIHPRGVRWTLVGEIALAWLSTIPAAALMASLWVVLFRGLHVVP